MIIRQKNHLLLAPSGNIETLVKIQNALFLATQYANNHPTLNFPDIHTFYLSVLQEHVASQIEQIGQVRMKGGKQ